MAARRDGGVRFSVLTPAILDRCFLFTPAIRRERLAALGGWDESLAIAYDWDCWLRLILAGCSAGIADEPLVHYRLRPGSVASRRAAALRERVVVLEKAGSNPDLRVDERRALGRSLRLHRRRALLVEAEAALRRRSPDARRRRLSGRSSRVGRRSSPSC